MRIRTFVLVASVLVALLCAAPAAFAVGPQTQPAVLQSVTFEGVNASDTLQVNTQLDPYNTYAAPPATWGIVSNSYASGGHGFWCAGSVPSAWSTYPVGTRGSAALYVPDATQDYSSQIQFSYLEPSLGKSDMDPGAVPFVVNWALSPVAGAGDYSDWQLPLTSTWTTVVRTRGAAGNNPPLTAGWLRFQFESSPSTAWAGAQGVTIDDIKVAGYVFGSPITIAATRQHGALTQANVSWGAPRAKGTNNPDPRAIYYRVWRHDIAADTWTEVTSDATSSLTIADSGLDVTRSYQYAVQGYTAPTDTTHWGISATSPAVGPAVPHFGAVNASAGSVAYGGASTISAPLTDELSAPFLGQAGSVELERSFNGGASWSVVSAAISEPTPGTYSAPVTSQTNTTYRLCFAPTNAMSAGVLVTSGTYLTVPYAPPHVTHNKAFAVKGSVSGSPVAARSITLRAYRKESKKVGSKKVTVWVLRSTVVAKVAAHLGVASYKVNMKVKLAGTYHLTAKVSDSHSTPVTTTYRTFTAK